jgi:hypothetical protein
LTVTNNNGNAITVNRDRYKTVTQFALLIPASELEAMGEATFESEAFGTSHVRAISLEEIKAVQRKLRGLEAARFGALLFLRGALESRDQLALLRAKERMEEFYRLRQAERTKTADPDEDRQLGAAFSQWAGLSAEETAKYMLGLRTGPKAAKDLRRLFSFEVTEAVGSMLQTRTVLWWFGGAFRPAIHCLDAKTALYVHTFFLSPVGALGFRICPYDGEQFFQDRPNQEYCCVAHREAHRVARFRDRQKRRVAESGKDRRKHGTQKTR